MSEEDNKKKIDADSTEDNTKENDDADVIVKEKKAKKRTIQINVSRDKEIEALNKRNAELELKAKQIDDEREAEKLKLEDEKKAIKEELEEKQAILEKQALEAFEKEKAEVIAMAKDRELSDEQMTGIEERLTDPEKLEMVKSLIGMLAPKAEIKPPEKLVGKPPAGKASITTPPTRQGSSEVYDTPEKLMTALYWKGYYARDGEVTVQERADARKKIDQLFSALIEGKAWEQLRGGKKRLPNQKVTFCPRCHDIIVGTPDKCPKCGHDLQEKLRKQGEEGSRW